MMFTVVVSGCRIAVKKGLDVVRPELISVIHMVIKRQFDPVQVVRRGCRDAMSPAKWSPSLWIIFLIPHPQNSDIFGNILEV